MSVESVKCNQCGAFIQVPTVARYVTCNRCGEHLVVHRSDVATFTEALPPHRRPHDQPPPDWGGGWRGGRRDEPDRDYRDVAERLDELAYQNELMRLDREWQFERERHMVTGRYGGRYTPSLAGSIIGAVVAVGFGAFWTAMAFGMAGGPGGGFGGPGVFFPLFGLLFIVVGLGGGVWGVVKALRYQEAYQTYLRRRRAVEQGWREPPPGPRRRGPDDD
jgi:hypothetical protein